VTTYHIESSAQKSRQTSSLIDGVRAQSTGQIVNSDLALGLLRVLSEATVGSREL